LEQALRSRYLLVAAAQLAVGATLWLALCLASPRPETAAIPGIHLLATGVMLLAVVRRSASVDRGLVFLMWLGVVLPPALQIAGGGFTATGGVMIWSLTSLVASNHLLDRGHARMIVGAFAVLVLLAGAVEVLSPSSPSALLSGRYTSIAFVLNLGGVVFGLGLHAAWLRADRARVAAALAVATQVEVDFLSTVSHEMRTPLTSILGFTEVTRKKLDKVVFPAVQEGTPKVERAVSQVRGNLRVMLTEGRRLTDLVDTVLDLHLMESGAIQWKQESIEISDLVGHAAGMCAILFMDRPEIEYAQTVTPDLPPLQGDTDRLVQVLVNLLTNAIKFTDAGSVGLAVERYQEGARSGVQFSISDSGPGISQEDQDAIFRHFRQGGEAEEKVAGSGLGLSIAKKIVEGHDGRMWVESELGSGATFSFRIPYR